VKYAITAAERAAVRFDEMLHVIRHVDIRLAGSGRCCARIAFAVDRHNAHLAGIGINERMQISHRGAQCMIQ